MNEDDVTEAIRKKNDNQRAKDEFKRRASLSEANRIRSMTDLADRLGGEVSDDEDGSSVASSQVSTN